MLHTRFHSKRHTFIVASLVVAIVLVGVVFGLFALVQSVDAATIDYDTDDDGLIEVDSLAQLNAIRWDLDGDGTPSSGNEATYTVAFPEALTGMGCNEDAANDADKVCIGYELTIDLDFDSDKDGDVDANDNSGLYWNNGAGWTPIGVFTAEFEGDGQTISNLFIRNPTTNAGLFDGIGSGGQIRNLGLTGLKVSGASGKQAGGLAGTLTGNAIISLSYVNGSIMAKGTNSKAGGLTGSMTGSSQILRSYTQGTVSSSGSNTRAGGLTGTLDGTTKILNSYATASVTASGTGASAGGLAAFFTGTAQVDYSYAIGSVTASGSNKTVGGLLAAKSTNVTVTASYWDTATTGQSTSPGGGTAKTTSQLQTPTSSDGIYADWNAGDDDNWDFGTANHYPTLKADWDGDGTPTAAEFGDQLIDYDTDDNGLIEVGNLAKLNAIRWDLDGNGVASSGNETEYFVVFPMPLAGMGCNEDEMNDADKVCSGYELTADLDFDTNDDGATNVTGDTYWNSGVGWTPIDAFAATLEGNGHTLSNLFINATTGVVGLFGTIAATGEVRNLGLIDVDVSNASTASNDRAGGLAGALNGDVSFIYVSSGVVKHTGASNAGGLIGNILRGGSVKTSWSSATVSAAAANTSAGGLVAGVGVLGGAASLADSYATGAVTNSGGRAGGLVGVFFAGTIDDSYATGAVSGATSGGLVGVNVLSAGTVTTSYYDSTTTGETGGKTTAELQTPTSNTGIYSDWNTDKWDFGTTSQYPALKADFNGDDTATAAEFGGQGRQLIFADGVTIADQELTQGMTYTSATAFPVATGSGTITYSIVDPPSGITLNSDRKLTGTATLPLQKTEYTYKATNDQSESASLSFILSVKPKKPKNFTAAASSTTTVDLNWTAIPGVSSWQIEQDSGSWTAISGSGASTNNHTIMSLTDGTEYTFKVRAVVGDSSATPSTKVIGVESDPQTATPSSDLIPVLPNIVGQLYVQGEVVDFTLPSATGGDGHPSYIYTLTPTPPSGLTFTASTHKLTGTPSTPQAKVSYTYTATESSDPDNTTESASRTFTIGIHPAKPTNFIAVAGNTEVTLSWDAMPDIDIWSIRHEISGAAAGNWYNISGSGATTTSYLRTGLTNGTEYTFRIVAIVGTGDTEVIGLASDPVSATPTSTPDLIPVLVTITDKTYVQGEVVDSTLPSATGGDGHPNYDYTLTPAPSSGLTFTASTHKLTGTPSKPLIKTEYTYTATESSDSDGTTESASRTFSIGIRPQKPANLTATSGDTQATLNWTAIAGVTNWQIKQNSGSWIAITGSSATTNSHTVTSLTNGPEYTFKVRAVVGTSSTRVNGVESDAVRVTPNGAILPVLLIEPRLPDGIGSDGQVRLTWTAIAGVSGWEYVQRQSSYIQVIDWDPWVAIAGSSASTNSHTITGLSNGTTYRFKVRAVVGSAKGVMSDTIVATPSKPPTFKQTIVDQAYIQGVSAVLLFPKATPGNPNNTYRSLRYSLSPANPSGFNQSAPVSFWRGTPNKPQAKTKYTYKVRESNGGVASLIFYVSVQPKKPSGFKATAGIGEVTLSWTPITGASGWQYQQNGGSWTSMSGSSQTTTSHAVSGLTAGTEYTFKIRAFVGTGNARVNGVESGAESATPAT